MDDNKQATNAALSIASETLQLILCALLSHALTDNPVTGGMMYLLYIASRMSLWMFSRIRSNRVLRFSMLTLTLISTAYMFVVCAGASGPLVMLVGVVMLRTSITELMQLIIPGGRALKTVAVVFIQAIFIGIFMLIFAGYFSNMILVAGVALFFASGALIHFPRGSPFFTRSESLKTPHGAFSYNVYTNMVLFSSIAGNIGTIIFISYLGFLYSAQGYLLYPALAGFFLAIILLYMLAARLIRTPGEMARLGLFIGGALVWCFAYCMFVTQESGALTPLWAGLWAFGLAAMRSVIDRFSDDFELLGALTGQPYSVHDLKQNNLLLQAVAFVTATLVALVMLGAERIILPAVPEYTVSNTFRFLMVFIPVGLMLVSVGFALRQPLDKRNMQRLVRFIESGKHKSKGLEARLRSLLVHKYRVRYGVKIIMALLRPIFRIKVHGAQNIDRSRFPSVFVCNHGFVYGPIAAVIYLPVYFRPWIDDRMVEKGLIIEQIMKAFARTPLPDGIKRAISSFLAAPARWALSSFEPIVVARSNLRNVMQTLKDTVQAMLESDNVLIFPENPQLTDNQYAHGRVGGFFSGFAQIGRMYFDATGECALFYPMYANRRTRTLRIGVPIEFSPDTPPKDERKRISEELHAAMSTLAQMP